MKAGGTTLLEFLSMAQTQFTIPIYQRTYSWEESHCRQLWNDILHAGRDRDTVEHFIGSVAYVSSSRRDGIQKVLRVIDGQQRLTTAMLILEALARRLAKGEIEDFSTDQIRYTYLLNRYGRDEYRYKLRLTQTDEESLKSVVQQKEDPGNMSTHIDENFGFFTEEVQKLKDDDLESLCKGLRKLTIIDMTLEHRDKPQRIFESMNSTGRRLSESDLIRNFVLMDLKEEQQNRLYKEYWRKMEVDFGQKEYEKRFDKFIRHYLTMKTGRIPQTNAIYEAFKDHTNKPEVKTGGMDKLMADVHKFAGYYRAMALGGKGSDEKLSAAFSDLRELGDIAYPLLLEIYDDYKSELLTRDDFEEAVRLIESYIFRRAICNYPSNSHGKIFAAFGKRLDKDRDLESVNRPTTPGVIFEKKRGKGGYLESIKKYLLALSGNQELPRDDDFEREFSTHRHLNDKYWLHRIENHARRKIDGYGVEHIMPKKLTKKWRRDLGSDWEDIHKKYLYAPGNLTLTRHNSELSNRPFTEKRDMEGGYKTSGLELDKGLDALGRWNEKVIVERSRRLAAMAVYVWSFPVLPKTPRVLSSTELYPTDN